MDAVELLTILIGALALAMSAVLALLCQRALRAARGLEAATLEFEAVATPALEELTEVTRLAAHDIGRVDDLVEVANAVGARVDTATDAAYRAFTSPVIKGVAFATGTRRAARSLRGSEDTTRERTR